MQMPQVQEQHKMFEKLAGKWKGEETIYPSPWDPVGGTATARIEARIDLDGFFLVSDYVEERGGRVSYRGHGVYGLDPKESSYTMHWFDSMGGGGYTLPAKGQWTGNSLIFQHEAPMGVSRYVYNFEGEGRYTFKIENSQDGKEWKSFMEARYQRV